MVFKEKDEMVIDQAWGHLYQRLQQDGLLPDKSSSEPYQFNQRYIKYAVAAALLIVGILSGWYLMRVTDAPSDKLSVLHNEANAPTLATMLEDESVVYLSEQSSLYYPGHFDDNKREVSLQGEAFFEISKNTGCPFLIETDLAIVEVIGTSFHVKSAGPASFLLSVTEGEVRVRMKKEPQMISVKTGETAFLETGRLKLIKTNVHWLDASLQRIHFKDEPLENVIRILNQHTDSIRFSIVPGIEDRLLTFTISENDPPFIAELICLALNLQYTQHENIIYISQRE